MLTLILAHGDRLFIGTAVRKHPLLLFVAPNNVNQSTHEGSLYKSSCCSVNDNCYGHLWPLMDIEQRQHFKRNLLIYLLGHRWGVGCTSVTDRQTTDGRATAYCERSHPLKMATFDAKRCQLSLVASLSHWASTLFAARLPWCSRSREFVSDNWSLFCVDPYVCVCERCALYTMGHKKGANLFSSVTLAKNQRILMQFSLLDLQMNDTCDAMNFTLLTWLVLLHYLVKVKTQHVILQRDITKESCIRWS